MNKLFPLRISVVAELGKIAFWKSINRVPKTFKRLGNLVLSTISLCKVAKNGAEESDYSGAYPSLFLLMKE